MMQELMMEVMQQMLPYLDNAQLKQQKQVTEQTFFHYEVTNSEVKTAEEDDSNKLIAMFIAAKRIEGCSEKTLKYYQTTIDAMVVSLRKNVRHILTEDLRTYLTEYQNKNLSSRVTIDNIRRILSSFFSWLEDEDYIIKSPVRRIHKVKTASSITTLSLLLIVLRDYAVKNPDDTTINARRIDNMLLKNEYETGDERYKLLLTETDRDILKCLVEEKPISDDIRSKLLDNYKFFVGKIANMELQPAEVYESIGKLQIVNITLDRSLDDAQASVMDRFFRDYLTMKITRIPKQDRVYEEFKRYHLNCEFGTIRELCQDVFTYDKYYTDMVFRRSTNPVLKALYEDMSDLRMEVAFPFLLRVHNDYSEGVIKEDELREIIRLCISYVFRRSICDIPPNSLNKTFATLKNEIKSDDYVNSIKAFFIMRDDYKEFPKVI